MDADKFEIKVLGGLEIQYKDRSIGVKESKTKSNKIWTLFEYILLNHSRKLSQDELIELLWPDMEVTNPANSLKGLIFKLRKEIDTLGFIPGKQVILSFSGSYGFNTQIPYTADIYEFEKYMKQADEAENKNERLDYLLKALDCYKGNVHQDARKEPWAASVQMHYGDMYISAVGSCAEILKERGDYQRIVEICRNALLIQPFSEECYYHMIRSFAAMENYSAAYDMYEKVKALMQKEYGTTPDTRFEAAYRELMKRRPKKNLSIEELEKKFKEENGYMSAFYVEFGEFKQIYRLTARKLRRAENAAYLCIYTLGAQKGIEVSKEEKNTHLTILGKALAFALRQGDVFARVTPHQFAVILDDVTEENIETIAKRISEYFERSKQNPIFGILHTYRRILPASEKGRAAHIT